MKTVYTILFGILLAVMLACGYGSKSSGASKMPAISQLSPDSTNAGVLAFMLTVNGSNFAPQAVVNWNGTPQATTYISSAQLMITVPASAVASSGTVKVTVTNPGTSSNGMYPGGSPAMTSQALDFTIR